MKGFFKRPYHDFSSMSLLIKLSKCRAIFFELVRKKRLWRQESGQSFEPLWNNYVILIVWKRFAKKKFFFFENIDFRVWEVNESRLGNYLVSTGIFRCMLN